MAFTKIDIHSVEGFAIGNAENIDAATGCTCIICKEGAVAGVDVRGGAPATTDTELLKSENNVEIVNAVVLSGGSAFGLEAVSGVRRELAESGIGYKVKGTDINVPIVVGASLFDLNIGKSDTFPDVLMGRQACRSAFAGRFETGNHGAGTGATVGKFCGSHRAMKAGIGAFACGDEHLQIGAIAAVNAAGDIYDGANNIIAGVTNDRGTAVEGCIRTLKKAVHNETVKDTREEVIRKFRAMGYDIPLNTTISCVITNAKLSKPQANKLASILHDAYARAIKPVHSTLDGDTVFVMASGKQEVNFDAFAALATDILQYSIIDAALSAEEAYGLKSAQSFKQEHK
ncbi:MAG: P1 family peptidase [Clostridiales bacterium]|nr:P1 family peptidase [Candidatus Crickella merdequi]